jgi:hypothetical protein
MAGNGKDHWLQNTRANDTGSIVEGYSLVYSIGDWEANLWPPAKLLNLLPLVRLRTPSLLDATA